MQTEKVYITLPLNIYNYTEDPQVYLWMFSCVDMEISAWSYPEYVVVSNAKLFISVYKVPLFTFLATTRKYFQFLLKKLLNKTRNRYSHENRGH